MLKLNINSRELLSLCKSRDEVPYLIARGENGELYRFADGTEVIVTNAGVTTEDELGFLGLKSEIMGA